MKMANIINKESFNLSSISPLPNMETSSFSDSLTFCDKSFNLSSISSISEMGSSLCSNSSTFCDKSFNLSSISSISEMGSSLCSNSSTFCDKRFNLSSNSSTFCDKRFNLSSSSSISEMGSSNALNLTTISNERSNLSSNSSTICKERLNLSSCLKRKRPPRIEIPSVLKEIEIEVDNQFKFGGFSPVKDDVVSRVEGGCVGLFSVKGKKKFMEDSHKIVSCIHGNPNKGFFGVYDGHGGRRAAEFVAERLHKNIIEMVEDAQGRMVKQEAVKAAYLKTDREFLEQDVGSGACCITVLIEGTEMVVSNVGDCRAVVCRGGVAEALTKDHRPEREDERKRIEDKGGYVEFHKGAWRVHGILSVSRSIGDAHLKDWVVSEPDTRIFDLAPDMDFLVLASDGLWEVVGCQEAINTVLELSPAEKKVNIPLVLDNKIQNTLEESKDEYTCVTTNSSPKVKRVSLINKHKQTTTRSSSFTKKNAYIVREDIENESPPTKLRRTALFPHKSMKNHSPSQENKRPSSEGIVTACKELANLAVTRGSMDDITVMIIDLNHFRKAIPRKSLPFTL